jgi:plasmid maintenance system antidote protein VapI
MSFERRTSAAWAIHPGEILKQEFLRPMGVMVIVLRKHLT